MKTMTDEKPSLGALRAEIDQIDDQLHDLIMRRSTIIERVRHAKASDRIKIRPAREADILYRLSARHHGIFPKQSLFRMWREMIVGTLALEAPFSVAVLSVPGNDCYKNLARDHFGPSSNLQTRGDAQGVIDLVVRDEATVGVLPCPKADVRDGWQDDRQDGWWHHLSPSDGPRLWIMARLPFFGRSNAKAGSRDALVVSAVEPEPSERDVSVYHIEGRADDLESAVCCLNDDRGSYVELDGFVTPDDDRMSSLKDRARWLGVYSKPIDDDELNAMQAMP